MTERSAVTMAVAMSHVAAKAMCPEPPRCMLKFNSITDRTRFMVEVKRQLEPLLHPKATGLIGETEFQISGIKFVCEP